MRLDEITEGLKDPKDNPCWKGYHPVGTKKKNGKTVPNCVPNANEGVAEGIMNTIANKVMGAAPEQPKYKVGQRVKYETSPHQPDWEDGGRGVGVITAYKNGHYMINGNPVNHFEIKGVVGQGVAEERTSALSQAVAEGMRGVREGEPGIKRVTRKRVDDSTEVRYHVIDSDGVTRKTFDDLKYAKEWLSAHRPELSRD